VAHAGGSAPGARARRVLATLALLTPLLAGCAGLHAYRPEPTFSRSDLALIENYGRAPVDPRVVDGLLREVAELLKIRLDPAVPPPRIIVTNPGQIARLYDGGAAPSARFLRAAALYFPGRRWILVPSIDRELLGHELAHYLTDHYLDVPRSEWEPIAHGVERRLRLGWRSPRGAAPAAETTGRAAAGASRPLPELP
jgi:hypothetical protein